MANQVEIIDGSDGTYGPYLLRAVLFKFWRFRITLHVFMRDDVDDFHDHPINFVSIGLAGSYIETTLEKDGKITQLLKEAPWLIFRRCTRKHKITLPNGPCITLIFSFKQKEDWGFWKDTKTYTPWREYFGYTE